MARTDAIVLGAGIVGTSVALQLVRRGMSVALVDRGAPGEGTSFGNAGVIGGAGVFPQAFPRNLSMLIRAAFKRAPQTNYHPRFLPRALPWLLAFRAASRPHRMVETARMLRPMMARSVAEHEVLMGEAGALRYLRKDGWMSVYRTDPAFAALRPELELGAELGVVARPLDPDAAQILEPSLIPVFRHAVHWPDTASVTNPLAVTLAYSRHFATLGGVVLQGDARTLHRANSRWRVETDEGPVDAGDVVMALGAWAPDVLRPLGVRLPLGIKRGYHRHFRPEGNATLNRPLLDAESGYLLAPMERGIRLTTGAEFADRDAPPTPVQLEWVTPRARELFPLGPPVEATPWLGSRPCFPDSRPVIGRAPDQRGLWLCYGHGHFGLTLGPVSGRLVAEMMTGKPPFCDPTPFKPERFY